MCYAWTKKLFSEPWEIYQCCSVASRTFIWLWQSRLMTVSVFLMGRFIFNSTRIFSEKSLGNSYAHIVAITQLLDLHYYVGFLLVLFLSLYFCVHAVFGAIFPHPHLFNYSISIWFHYGSDCMLLCQCWSCLKNFKVHTWLFMLNISLWVWCQLGKVGH